MLLERTIGLELTTFTFPSRYSSDALTTELYIRSKILSKELGTGGATDDPIPLEDVQSMPASIDAHHIRHDFFVRRCRVLAGVTSA